MSSPAAKPGKSPKSLVVKGAPLSKESESSEPASWSLPPLMSKTMMRRCNALKNLQVNLIELEAKFYEEMHVLESKYAAMCEPLYEKRKKIVTGEMEPTDEEATWKYDLDEEAEGKGVKDFWLVTLQSFSVTKDIIMEHDEPILAYLTDIRVKFIGGGESKQPLGYTLEFEFAENPFFTNKVLTKTYELKTEIDKSDPFSYDGPSLARAIGCKIDWKPEQNVTVKLIKKKLKSKNKKAPPKIITKEEKQDSFFNFFVVEDETAKAGSGKKGRKTSESASSGTEDSSHKQLALKKKQQHGGDDDEDEEDEDDDEMYKLADFEIGEYIKDKIVPKAILYFTGDYEDYDEDDEDDEDDEEDVDDEDEEEEEEHHHGKKGGKGGVHKHNHGGHGHAHGGHHAHPHAHGGGAHPKMTNGKPGETPAECKQQ